MQIAETAVALSAGMACSCALAVGLTRLLFTSMFRMLGHQAAESSSPDSGAA